MSTTDVFGSPVTGLSYWMQSKGHSRLDAECKGQSLQDFCRLFAWKFFSQTQQQGNKQAEEPLSAYVVMRLIPSSDPGQMSGALGRPKPSFFVAVLLVWN
ncbi:hypothetical protein TNCV_4325761 [Trichonephila clavipes]|nr:hypothetical protein TNCV_4325761 [Trichonephila clavipes]